MIDNDRNVAELREKTEIASNALTKLRRDEEVSMAVLIKISKVLNANIRDVMDLIPNSNL